MVPLGYIDEVPVPCLKTAHTSGMAGNFYVCVYCMQVNHTFGYLDQDYGMINEKQLAFAESTTTARTAGWCKETYPTHAICHNYIHGS